MNGKECVSSVKLKGQFDENLNHISSNYAMQNFIGDNLMHSMYRLVHSADADKMERMIRRAQAGNECIEIIRLLSTEDYFVNFTVKLSYDTENECLDIEMSNTDENEAILDKLNRDIRALRAHLTLQNDILINYNITTKSIRLYMIADKMDVTLYEMKIDAWQEQMINKGYVYGEHDIKMFRKMCEDIKALKPDSCYEFKSKIIRKGEQLDNNRVRLKTIFDMDDVVEIIGRWMVVNEATGEAVEDFCIDTYIDPLTELMNKKAITDYAKEAVAMGVNSRVGFAMLDLDNFKAVNDTYGHLFGDEVLRNVGKIIKDAVSEIAVAGRMGGDEFFIVFKDYVDELHMRNVLRTIKLNIVSYFQGKMGDIQLSCSIGASRSDVDSRDYYRLFKVADKALYIAKQKGKNRYIIYKTELHGEFKADEHKAQVEMKENYYDELDMNSLGNWLRKVLINGKSEIAELLEQMAKVFHFDRVGVYLDMGNRAEYEYRKSGVVPGNGIMIQEPKYLGMFKGDILIVENVNTVEYAVPNVYRLLVSTDTKSMIQVLIRDLNEEVTGVISFDTCSNFVTYPKAVVENIKNYGNILSGIML